MLFWFKSSYNRFLCASCRIYGIYGENIFFSRNLYDSHRNVYTKNGWRKFFSNAFQLMQEFAQANRQFGLGLQPLMLYIRKQMTDAYQYKQCALQYLCFQVGIISKTTIQICEHLDNIRPTKTFIRRRRKNHPQSHVNVERVSAWVLISSKENRNDCLSSSSSLAFLLFRVEIY